MASSVACGWVGAVMSLFKPRNSEIHDRKLNDTDRRTDRQTDVASYRVACTRLKDRKLLALFLLLGCPSGHNMSFD